MILDSFLEWNLFNSMSDIEFWKWFHKLVCFEEKVFSPAHLLLIVSSLRLFYIFKYITNFISSRLYITVILVVDRFDCLRWKKPQQIKQKHVQQQHTKKVKIWHNLLFAIKKYSGIPNPMAFPLCLFCARCNQVSHDLRDIDIIVW